MKLPILCAGWLLLVIAANAQSVKVHADRAVDLTRYETFTVLKGELLLAPDQPRSSENAVYEIVLRGVRQSLEERGYQYVADSSAQLWVSYVAGAYNSTNAGNTGPLGGAPASDPSQLNQSREWSNTVQEGMVVIDITESTSKKELWKAESSNLSMSSGDLTRVIDGVIYRAFRKFPDKNKKKRK